MKAVLHVIRKLDPGGVECWLSDLALAGGVPGFSTEILVETDDPGELESQLVRLGIPVHRWRTGNCWALFQLFRQRKFTAVHSHVHAFSGIVLAIAKLSGIPCRVAHSHCCDDGQATPGRRAYFRLMQRLMAWATTAKLAVSGVAGHSLFGSSSFEIVPCARHFESIDPAPRLPDSSIVLGHVGRPVPEKNRGFILQLARRLASTVLFAPDLKPGEVYARADVFVFPSLKEGLGLALIEAQAAGLPCVASDAIPPEACVVPGLVERLSLEAGEDAWIAAIRRAAARGRHPDPMAWIARSPFTLDASIGALREVYARAS